MRDEVPLTPTRKERHERYAQHRRELTDIAPEVPIMPEGCYPILTMVDDQLRMTTVVNITCDHGASATEVSFAEQLEDSEACVKAAVHLLALRHEGFPAETKDRLDV